jgi:tetratricopeptide (TPR) repeat protein
MFEFSGAERGAKCYHARACASLTLRHHPGGWLRARFCQGLVYCRMLSCSIVAHDHAWRHLLTLAEIKGLEERVRAIESRGSLTRSELRDLVFEVAAGFRTDGRLFDLVRVVGHAKTLATEAGWHRLVAELANIQGMNHLLGWRPDQAQPFFEEAARLWAAEDVASEEGRSLINLAQAHFDLGATAAAKMALAEAEALARLHDLRALEAQAVGFLGSLLFHHEGRYDDASNAFQRASVMYRELGDEAGLRKIAGRRETLIRERLLVAHEWSGVASESKKYLYRGEGRLRVEGVWSCESHPDLAAHFRKAGFATRRPQGTFAGTLVEQILQQGYVNQNTVSLTDSPRVACEYALGGGQNQGGVVFKIDRSRLASAGPVYDSFDSMRKYLSWVFPSELTLLGDLVRALDVREGGAFLGWLARETRSLVDSGRDLEMPPPVWSEVVSPARWNQLQERKIDADRLDGLYHALRGFWLLTAGREGPLGYYGAFRSVQQQLCDVQAAATDERKRNPGWQTTPFGYMAKTCRDREFFSTGAVSPDCIVGAFVVSVKGAVMRRLSFVKSRPSTAER